MTYPKTFEGCKALIYTYGDKKLLTESIIVDFDRSSLVVTFNSRSLDNIRSGQVILLIFVEDLLYEYEGTVRKPDGMGRQQVALFHGQQKEGRTATRYTVNLPGQVTTLLIAGKSVPLRHSLEVVVLNISTKGVLLRAAAGSMNVNTSFQLKMNIGESETVINSRVARINLLDSDFAEYGCRFQSVAG